MVTSYGPLSGHSQDLIQDWSPVPLTHTNDWSVSFQAIIRDNKDVQFQKLQTSEVPYRLNAFCVSIAHSKPKAYSHLVPSQLRIHGA